MKVWYSRAEVLSALQLSDKSLYRRTKQYEDNPLWFKKAGRLVKYHHELVAKLSTDIKEDFKKIPDNHQTHVGHDVGQVVVKEYTIEEFEELIRDLSEREHLQEIIDEERKTNSLVIKQLRKQVKKLTKKNDVLTDNLLESNKKLALLLEQRNYIEAKKGE